MGCTQQATKSYFMSATHMAFHVWTLEQFNVRFETTDEEQHSAPDTFIMVRGLASVKTMHL